MGSQALSTRIPEDLAATMDRVCTQLGLKKSFLVEQALREKLEDLLDTADLKQAVAESTGFHDWEQVKAEAGGRKRK